MKLSKPQQEMLKDAAGGHLVYRSLNWVERFALNCRTGDSLENKGLMESGRAPRLDGYGYEPPGWYLTIDGLKEAQRCGYEITPAGRDALEGEDD